MGSESGAVKWTLATELELKVGGKLGRGVKPANCEYEGNCTEERGTVRES